MADSRAVYGSVFKHGGREIRIDPEMVMYDEGALDAVPDVAARFTKGRAASVIMDARTRDVAGGAVAAAMLEAAWQVQALVVPDRDNGRGPMCDDLTRDALRSQLAACDVIVAVGSGVINDLSKWLAYESDIPYICVATAASMNGYTSANVAPTVAGVKQLERARPPKAVLACPGIVASAPYEMTAAGLGDALAKSVSAADWHLNHVLFGDDYVKEAVDLIADIEPLYLRHPESIRARDPGAMKALYDALLLTGVAMTMAGTSAPASGGEHLVSHGLDMLSSLDGAEHDLHGRQVGIGTILASELYRRMLKVESPEIDAERAIASEFSFWGALSTHVEEAYEAKIDRIYSACESLRSPGAWDGLRSSIAMMARHPDVTRDCLAAAGGAYRPEHIGCAPERLASVFEHCHEIRSRFTILDLARIAGIMPLAAREIVEGLV
jgi:glycerol-1-phosphate dehydrogenase [NAD(P)+]